MADNKNVTSEHHQYPRAMTRQSYIVGGLVTFIVRHCTVTPLLSAPPPFHPTFVPHIPNTHHMCH